MTADTALGAGRRGFVAALLRAGGERAGRGPDGAERVAFPWGVVELGGDPVTRVSAAGRPSAALGQACSVLSRALAPEGADRLCAWRARELARLGRAARRGRAPRTDVALEAGGARERLQVSGALVVSTWEPAGALPRRAP